MTDTARDFELVEFQLQHAATWATLSAVQGQRDLCIKLHGGLAVVFPFLVERLSFLGVFMSVSVALTLLSYVTWTLRGVCKRCVGCSFRCTQPSATVGSSCDPSANQPTSVTSSRILRCDRWHSSRTRMGLTVGSVRVLLLFDVFVTVGLLSYLLACAASESLRQPEDAFLATVLTVGLCAAVAACVSGLVRLQVDRAISDQESSTSAGVVARYNELGVTLGTDASAVTKSAD